MKHMRTILSLTASILGIILLTLSIVRSAQGETNTALLCTGLLCTNIGVWSNISRRRREEKKKEGSHNEPS